MASLAFLTASFFEAIIDVAFKEAVIRRPQYSTSVIDTAFTAMLTCSIVGFLVLCAIAPLAAAIYNQPVLIGLFIVQGLNVVIVGLRGIPEALLARKLRFRTVALRGIVAKIVGMVTSITLAMAGAGAWALVLGNVTFAAVAAIMVYSAIPRWPRLDLNWSDLQELLSFGVFSIADALFGSATPRLFMALIAYFSGVATAGAVSIAFRVNEAVGAVISTATIRLALPLFSRLSGLDRENYKRTVTTGTRLAFLIAAPVFVGMCLVSGNILELTVGPEWKASGPSLVAAALFSLLNYAAILSNPVMKALGRPERAALVPAVGFFVVLVGTLSSAPLGLSAQLAVWVLFGWIFFLISTFNLKSIANIKYYEQFKSIFLTLISCAIMATAVLGVEQIAGDRPHIIILFTKIIVGVTVYLIITLALQGKFLVSINKG